MPRAGGAAALFGVFLTVAASVCEAPAVRAEPPRFIAPSGFVELQRAFAADAIAATSAAHLGTMPAFADTAALGDDIGRLLTTGTLGADPVNGEPRAELLSSQPAAPVTTSDLQATLAQARADAGEARALSDELHKHADALSRRMAQGGLDTLAPEPASSSAPAAAAPVDLAAARATALREAAALQSAARQAESRQAVAQEGGAKQGGASENSRSDDDEPASVADAGSTSGNADAPARQLAPKQALPGRMALGHVVALDAASDADTATAAVAANAHAAEAGEPPIPARGKRADPAKSSRGMAAAEKHRSGRRPAVGHPASVSAPVKAAALNPGRSGSQPGASGVTAAAAKAGGADGSSRDTKPAIEAAASGGLFSWLKPFQFPKEIGALGWSN